MNCNLDIAKIEFSYCINVNVGEIFVLLSNNIVILKYLIALIFSKLQFFNSVFLLFLFKHISLIVFFCNFAPENHNSQKREQK